MKKYLLGAFAVVLAVGFSAFTSVEAPKAEKKQVTINIVYNSGTQNLIGSYSQSTGSAPTCPGAVRLCAIRVVDPNSDGVISQAEFTTIFNALDTDSDGTLDDQTETTTLLKKA
jgi:hypothetical protein